MQVRWGAEKMWLHEDLVQLDEGLADVEEAPYYSDGTE